MLGGNEKWYLDQILGRMGKGQQNNNPVLTWWIEKKGKNWFYDLQPRESMMYCEDNGELYLQAM